MMAEVPPTTISIPRSSGGRNQMREPSPLPSPTLARRSTRRPVAPPPSPAGPAIMHIPTMSTLDNDSDDGTEQEPGEIPLRTRASKPTMRRSTNAITRRSLPSHVSMNRPPSSVSSGSIPSVLKTSSYAVSPEGASSPISRMNGRSGRRSLASRNYYSHMRNTSSNHRDDRVMEGARLLKISLAGNNNSHAPNNNNRSPELLPGATNPSPSLPPAHSVGYLFPSSKPSSATVLPSPPTTSAGPSTMLVNARSNPSLGNRVDDGGRYSHVNAASSAPKKTSQSFPSTASSKYNDAGRPRIVSPDKPPESKAASSSSTHQKGDFDSELNAIALKFEQLEQKKKQILEEDNYEDDEEPGFIKTSFSDDQSDYRMSPIHSKVIEQCVVSGPLLLSEESSMAKPLRKRVEDFLSDEDTPEQNSRNSSSRSSSPRSPPRNNYTVPNNSIIDTLNYSSSTNNTTATATVTATGTAGTRTRTRTSTDSRRSRSSTNGDPLVQIEGCSPIRDITRGWSPQRQSLSSSPTRSTSRPMKSLSKSKSPRRRESKTHPPSPSSSSPSRRPHRHTPSPRRNGKSSSSSTSPMRVVQALFQCTPEERDSSSSPSWTSSSRSPSTSNSPGRRRKQQQQHQQQPKVRTPRPSPERQEKQQLQHQTRGRRGRTRPDVADHALEKRPKTNLHIGGTSALHEEDLEEEDDLNNDQIISSLQLYQSNTKSSIASSIIDPHVYAKKQEQMYKNAKLEDNGFRKFIDTTEKGKRPGRQNRFTRISDDTDSLMSADRSCSRTIVNRNRELMERMEEPATADIMAMEEEEEYIGELAFDELVHVKKVKETKRIETKEKLRIMNLSSTIIQSKWRGGVARTNFITMWAAAVMIEACARGRAARKLRKKMVRGVVLCQSHWRGSETRADLEFISSFAVAIQAFIRGSNARATWHHTIFVIVAIQRMSRGLMARKQLAKQHESATIIQTKCRTSQAITHYETQKASILKLQTFARTSLARSRLQTSITGFVALQRLLREKIRNDCAIVLQTKWREIMCKSHYQNQKDSALKLESCARMLLAKKSLRSAIRGCIALQRLCRGINARRLWAASNESVIIIQRYVRTYCAQKRYSSQRIGAIQLQAFARKCAAQVQLQMALMCCCALQAIHRGNCIRKELEAQHRAATVVQSQVRCHQSKSEYQAMDLAARKIQSVVRGGLDRVLVKFLILYVEQEVQRQAATTIQRSWRCSRDHSSYMAMQLAALRLQSQARGARVRQQERDVKERAAIVIQKYWRRTKAKINFRFVLAAAAAKPKSSKIASPSKRLKKTSATKMMLLKPSSKMAPLKEETNDASETTTDSEAASSSQQYEPMASNHAVSLTDVLSSDDETNEEEKDFDGISALNLISALNSQPLSPVGSPEKDEVISSKVLDNVEQERESYSLNNTVTPRPTDLKKSPTSQNKSDEDFATPSPSPESTTKDRSTGRSFKKAQSPRKILRKLSDSPRSSTDEARRVNALSDILDPELFTDLSDILDESKNETDPADLPKIAAINIKGNKRSLVSRLSPVKKKDSGSSKHSPIIAKDSLPKKSRLLRTLDDEVGIAKGDVIISLLTNYRGPDSDSSLNGEIAGQSEYLGEDLRRSDIKVRDAIWRNRRQRRLKANDEDKSYAKTNDGSISRKEMESMHSAAAENVKSNEFDDALEIYEEMLSAYQDSNPEQSQCSEKSSKSRKGLPTDRRPYIAATLHNIAIVHMLNLRFKRALPYLTKAVTIRREYLEEGDPDQVVSLVKYGICNFALGNFGESQAAFKMALSTSPAGHMNEVSNEDTIADLAQMGEVLNNLACLSLHAGQATLALQTLKQALEVLFAALSDSLYLSSQRTSSSSILMAISVIRGNVGYIDLKLNESDAAVVAFQASLMHQQMVLKDTDETLMITMDHLAMAHFQRKSFDRATQILHRLYHAQVHNLNPTHLEVAQTLCKLAVANAEAKNYEEALECVRRVHHCRSKNNEPALSTRFLSLAKVGWLTQETICKIVKKAKKAAILKAKLDMPLTTKQTSGSGEQSTF